MRPGAGPAEREARAVATAYGAGLVRGLFGSAPKRAPQRRAASVG